MFIKKQQKRELIIMFGLYLVLGILIQIYYPYPFVYPDSGAYLLSAAEEVVNAWRPMGYSYYIRFVHAFSPSLTVLYWVSYGLNAIACILFLFSVKYLFKITSKILFYTFAGFMIFSPSLLFCTNYLMSDGLFCTLTILWITSNLWIIKRANWWIIGAHLVLLIFIYATRYIGMAYVPVSVGVLLLALFKEKKRPKAFYYALLLLPIVVISITQKNMKETYRAAFHVDTLSPFGGWQWLNNVSPILPDARDLHLQTIKGKKERELHQFLMQFPDSVYSIESMLGTSPMWDKSLPLKQYLFYRIQQQNSSYPLCFAKVGVTFESYAKQIALRYPFQYVKRYIVPSFCSVFLYQYQDITDWNNPFQSEKFTEDYFEITPVTHEHPATIFPFVNSLRHVFHSVYWIAGVLCTLFFAFNIKKYSKEREKFFLLLTLIGFIVIYIGGSVVASPNTTWRYSMPFYAPSLAFMLVILRDALQYITKSLTTSTKTI